MREISLKDARAKLSAVLDQVIAGEPAVITRRGRKQAVMLSFQDYEKAGACAQLWTIAGSISR